MTALVFAVGGETCVLPSEHVVETMRPLPVSPMDAMPPFVLGAAVIRGASVPVIDAARLLGIEAPAPSRFITISADGRVAALAVNAVRGIEEIEAPDARPPVLSTDARHAVQALAARDRALYLVLDGIRLVTDHGTPA